MLGQSARTLSQARPCVHFPQFLYAQIAHDPYEHCVF